MDYSGDFRRMTDSLMKAQFERPPRKGPVAGVNHSGRLGRGGQDCAKDEGEGSPTVQIFRNNWVHWLAPLMTLKGFR
jgi:hypothetical protein